MSAPPPSSTVLTAAQKAKLTKAANAERERQEHAAFVAKSIWLVDQPGSRKRTTSTDQASAAVKKAHGTKETEIPSEDETVPEVPAVKVKASARKYAAPKIDVDSDGSHPQKPVHLDFTKLPQFKAKSTGTKVKAAVSKGLKALTRSVKSAAKKTSAKETSKPSTQKGVATGPARVIAESASESESEALVLSEDRSGSDQSNVEDVSPNAEEFRTEVPRVIASKKSNVTQKSSGEDSDADVEMPKVKGKQRARDSAEDLFNESVEIDKPRVSRSQQAMQEPDSDDTFSDVPRRLQAADSDVEMPLAIAKSSRRSSTSSRSSGHDLRVPDSDAEDSEAEITKPTLKRKKSAASSRASVGRHHSAASGAPGDSEPDDAAKSKKPAYKKQALATPQDDSDREFHEAMQKGLVTIPRSPRSSAADLGPVSDSDDDAGPSSKKPRKVSARQKQADMEKPKVRVPAGYPGPSKLSKGLTTQLDRIAAAAADAASQPEESWHISARIMFPAPGKDIGLTDQGEELKAVLRGCVEFIKLSLLFEDSYPTIGSRHGYARSFLISAVQLPGSNHIRERLETDLSFGARLADIPLDRINILRSDFKRFATQEVPAHYKLTGIPPSEVQKIVNDRLHNHGYVFPVDASTASGRLKTELPFLNEAIVSVLRKAVFSSPQFKTKNLHLFASTSTNHPDRLELPDAMVSLAATAVFGALVEYRATGTQQRIPFTGGAYEDTYRTHMKTLSDTRVNARVALHKILHTLFNRSTDTTAVQATAVSASVLINLVEVEESD